MQQSCLLFRQSHHLGQFQKSHFQRKIDNHTVRKILCIALRMLHLKLLRLFYFISAFTPYGSIKFAFWCKLHGFFIILITHNKYIHNLRCAASRHTYKLYHKTCKQFYAIFFYNLPNSLSTFIWSNAVFSPIYCLATFRIALSFPKISNTVTEKILIKCESFLFIISSK